MEKILIVDDSILQAAQLKAILADEYDVTVVQTAEEAALCRQRGFFPDTAGRCDAGNGRFYTAEKIAGGNHH